MFYHWIESLIGNFNHTAPGTTNYTLCWYDMAMARNPIEKQRIFEGE